METIFRHLALLLCLALATTACRKKKSGDDSTDLGSEYAPALVVSGDQPASGDTTVVVSSNANGSSSVILVAGPASPDPAPAPAPSPAPADEPASWRTTIGNVTAAEDAAFTRTADGQDVDGHAVSYALDTTGMTCDDGGWSPALALHATTGVLTGTPTNAAVGSCTVRITASSSGGSVSQTFTVTVTNTDDVPTWSSTILSFNHNEDTAISKTAVASDVDAGSVIAYSLDFPSMTCDDGAFSPQIAIDSTSGALTGTPTNADVGSCTVEVLATSAGQTIAHDFTITVINVNDMPTWSPAMADFQISRETSAAGNYALAADVDAGSSITYALDTGNMTCDDGAWSPNVSINGATGELAGTPHLADVGTCTLRIQATSGADTITDDVTVTVTNVSTPPTWDATISTQNINEDSGLSATADATDTDGDTVSYSLDLANMTCDNGAWSPQVAVHSVSGVLSGTPTNADVGSCTVRVRASSGGDNIFQTFTVNVANTNDLPTWSSLVGDFSVAEDAAIAKTAVASDIDPAASITYSLDTAAMTCDNGSFSPALAIHATTGAITGTPTNSDVGTCTIKIVATSGGDSISETLTLTVVNTNDLPTWNPTIGNLTRSQGSPIAATAVAVDVDSGSSITYALDAANMTCDNGSWSPAVSIHSGTGVLTGTPALADVGSCTIRVTATSAGDTIAETFTVTVQQVFLDISGPIGVITGDCNVYSANLQNASGGAVSAPSNVTVSLAVNNGTGTFYTSGTCATSTTSVVISSGQSAANVYFRSNTAPQNLTLVATSSNYETNYLNVAVGGTPTKLLLSGPDQIGTGDCRQYLVQRVDNFGNALSAASAVTVDLTENGSATFYSDSGCGSSTSTIQIGSGSSGANVYMDDNSAESLTLTATDNAAVLTASNLGVTVSVSPTWWNGGWGKRVRIALNNLDQATTFTDQPVLVKLTTARVDYADINADGSDLRFVDSTDTTTLAYDIDSWSHGGTSYVWVKVNSITASSAASFIYMYYDNASAPVGEAENSVWSSYWGVWHLEESPAAGAPQYKDGTSSARHGTASASPLSATSVIGKGLDVRANVNDNVDLGVDMSPVLGATSTFSTWVKTNQVGNNTSYLAPGITGVEQGGGGNDIFFGWIDGSGYIGVTAGNGAAAKSNFIVNDNVWRHVTITRNQTSGAVQFFVNGVLNGSGTSETGAKTTYFDQFGIIGDTSGSPEDLNGYLDEIRIYSGVQTTERIRADYKFMTDAYLSFGEVETP